MTAYQLSLAIAANRLHLAGHINTAEALAEWLRRELEASK